MPRGDADGPQQQAGLGLARAYFLEVVEPVLQRHCPAVPWAAARIGTGSDVLGLDDDMSQDHDWGLRLQLFVPADDVAGVLAALETALPDSFRSHPVRFAFSGQDADRLGIDVTTVSRFAVDRLGFDPGDGVTTAQWLSLSGQAVLEVAAGEVFRDRAGDLTRLRESVTWYPDDVWHYVVACDWRRLDQELPLMGRAGHVGDELGSRTTAARLVDVAVHLAFTLSRQWQPYSKWRGTMLRRLPLGRLIADDLHAVIDARRWQDRGAALASALERLAEAQSELGLPTCRPVVVPFWDRPYLQIDQTLVPAILDAVSDAGVRGLPVGVGSIEQQTDNVDVLVDPARRTAGISRALR